MKIAVINDGGLTTATIEKVIRDVYEKNKGSIPPEIRAAHDECQQTRKTPESSLQTGVHPAKVEPAGSKNEYASLAIRRGKNEFLTIHHALKKKEHPWRFPGGKLDAGETPRAAAIRECREEIGILPLNLVEIGTDTTYVDGAHWTGHFFLVTRWQGEIVLKEPHKHDCYSWDTPERLQELDSHPEAEMAAKACDEGFGFYRPARVVVPPCSRPFPHICKVNGPCNGWPKEVVVA